MITFTKYALLLADFKKAKRASEILEKLITLTKWEEDLNLQLKVLINVITMGPREPDNINRKITLTE